jgi:hypothetical protein
MAEGPLVHYYASKLEKILPGKKVQVEFGIHKLKASEPSLRGLRVTGVEVHGKRCRIHFSENLSNFSGKPGESHMSVASVKDELPCSWPPWSPHNRSFLLHPEANDFSGA